MRSITTATEDAWDSGDFTGDNRPARRVTVAQGRDLLVVPHGRDRYSSLVYGQASRPRELPNVKNVSWERSVLSDAASATITLYNVQALPVGTAPPNEFETDLPGYFTYNYGVVTEADPGNPALNRYGHAPNMWRNMLRPGNIVRTYEGYGVDYSVIPEDDPNLYQTGVWIIDDVESGTDGLLKLVCRDFGAKLIDELAFPPVVPLDKYPLKFARNEEVDAPEIDVADWVRLTFTRSSNRYTIDNWGGEHGHPGADATDSLASTYWMSTGNARPSRSDSFEWWEGRFVGSARTVSAVQIKVWGGPYRVYISLQDDDGRWRGRHNVPYDGTADVVDNEGEIRYVKAAHADKNERINIEFPRKFNNIRRIRVTFTNLYNSGLGDLPYRAGLRDIRATATHNWIAGGTKTVGDYDDYTDIIKLICAYTAFWWPSADHNAFIRRSDGTYFRNGAPTPDPVLHRGRVWGDFELTGTNGPAELGSEIFDKKPMMDAIHYVRDIVGFNFFIDETGGAIFRSPNIWRKGNYVWMGETGGSSYTTDHYIIDERKQLLSVNSKVSGRNLREHVFVGNVTGRIADARRGILREDIFRRVAIWTDQHFTSTTKATIMADLIAVRQMLTYRTDQVRIAANPGIQIDDQVKVIERLTSEHYFHYVISIKSDNDAESGRWTYDLDTHWLGYDPDNIWFLSTEELSSDTQLFLEAMGRI